MSKFEVNFSSNNRYIAIYQSTCTSTRTMIQLYQKHLIVSLRASELTRIHVYNKIGKNELKDVLEYYNLMQCVLFCFPQVQNHIYYILIIHTWTKTLWVIWQLQITSDSCNVLWNQRKSSWASACSIINPFQNKSWFSHVCSTSLLKTIWKEKKLFVTSNFSFSHSVFYLLRRTFWHFDQVSNCRLQTLSVWKSLKFVIWKRINP